MKHAAFRSHAAVALIALASCAVFAVDPPDLRINTVSGLIEAVDATWSGANYNVRYTATDESGRQTASLLLTSNGKNDFDPRIAVSLEGDAWVTWWRDSSPNLIVYRKHVYATGVWEPERVVGDVAESDSRPRIAYFGDTPWVVYQIQGVKSRSVGAQIIDDDPEPVRSIIATTTYPGDLDLQIQAESGRLWVTWIDTGSRVGYSVLTDAKGVWAPPAYESYATDSVASARARIRTRLIGID
jgi:hypothetical protein